MDGVLIGFQNATAGGAAQQGAEGDDLGEFFIGKGQPVFDLRIERGLGGECDG